jgi:hypothetical protein
MNKILILCSVMFCIGLILGCSSKTGQETSVPQNQQVVTQQEQSLPPEKPVTKSNLEKENYIKANAAVTCYQMSSDSLGYDESDANNPYDKIAAQYGFTMSELESLKSTYGDDSVKKAVGAEMNIQCPDVIKQLSGN